MLNVEFSYIWKCKNYVLPFFVSHCGFISWGVSLSSFELPSQLFLVGAPLWSDLTVLNRPLDVLLDYCGIIAATMAECLCCFFSPQSQPEMEYSLPELQAPRSNVADKPWPQVHSHTQRPHGEHKHTHLFMCSSTCRFLQHSLISIQLKSSLLFAFTDLFVRCEGTWREGSIQSRRQREAPSPARRRPHRWAWLPRLHVKVSRSLSYPAET